MADNAARPPVAVRIVRPYDTEEAFLESELETIGKTSVILIGAHTRPTGVILRFEVTLANGNVVLRGEGRVLAHKESAFRGQAGLALRYTRLDPKSKALVDRAAAVREARLSGSMPPHIPRAAESSGTPIPTAPSSSQSVPPSPPSSQPALSQSVPPSLPSVPPEPESARTVPPSQTSPPSQNDTVPPGTPSIAPLAAMPSFAPLDVPSSAPSAPNPNMTIAPDAMLAQLLTAPTPPPPAARMKSDRPTSKPPPPEPDVEVEVEVEAQAPVPSNVHATTTVAAPPLPASAAPPEPPPIPPPPPAPKPTDSAVTRVADRNALLARLRERRASMSDEEKDDILRSRSEK